MTKPYREESRENYYGVNSGDATIEQINAGSLQRIADATEAMAKNWNALQRERDMLQRMYRNASAEVDHLARQRAALRGVITRMKRRQS